MSETATEATETGTEGRENEAAKSEPKEPDWKAEARKWEARAKENKSAADRNKTAAEKLAEIEAASKTEAEKLTERAAAAEKRAAETEARLLRLEVAAEKGLNASQARRLVGSTREELAADADELVKTFQPPTPSFDGGARKSAPAPADMNKLLRQAIGREQ